jgi:hypothetical protein
MVVHERIEQGFVDLAADFRSVDSPATDFYDNPDAKIVSKVTNCEGSWSGRKKESA